MNAQAALSVTPEPITLTFDAPVNLTAVDTWQSTGTMTITPMSTRTNSLSLNATDLLTIVKLHP